MRTLKLFVMVCTMLCAVTFGGLITTGCNADEQDDVITEEAITEEVIEQDDEQETVEQEIAQDDGRENIDIEEDEQDTSPAGIIESQTGLCIDYIKHIEGNGTWDAYYIEADGDIYAVTIKKGDVDVVAQLN